MRLFVLRAVGTTAAVAALLISVTGCVGPSRSNPAQVAEHWLHALAAGDAGKACEVMYLDKRPMETADDKKACVAKLEPVLATDKAKQQFGPYKHAKVTGAEVDGSKAEVDADAITGVIGSTFDIDLVKIGDKWWVKAADLD